MCVRVYALDLTASPQVAKYLNPTVITLEQAPQAYKTFMDGEARKYFIDPNGMLASAGYTTQHA